MSNAQCPMKLRIENWSDFSILNSQSSISLDIGQWTSVISNLLSQQILYNPEQFPPRHRTRRGMPNPALLPVHDDLAVLLKQETISAANLEFLGTQAAEPHLGRFLFLLCGGFVENELLELPGKDDPRELERMHDQVGAAG